VSNLCHQLYSSRMSGALVSGIAFIHVSVSRGRFLRRRFACVRPAAARTLRIQIQDRGRTTVDTRRPTSDIEPAGMKSERPGRASANTLGGTKSLDRIHRMNKIKERTRNSKDIFRCHLIGSFSNLVNPVNPVKSKNRERTGAV